MWLRICGVVLIFIGLTSVVLYFMSERSAAMGVLGVVWIGFGASLLVRASRKPPRINP